jgi:hypothetical protein
MGQGAPKKIQICVASSVRLDLKITKYSGGSARLPSLRQILVPNVRGIPDAKVELSFNVERTLRPVDDVGSDGRGGSAVRVDLDGDVAREAAVRCEAGVAGSKVKD